jgi:PAS domain S-box-containing protein
MNMPQKPSCQELEKRVRDLEFSLKAAKDDAKKKEDFLNSLINAIPIPVFYKDRDGKYVGCNEAFETFFGKKREQIIGKSAFDINPPKLAEIYYAKDNELFKDGGIQRYHSQVKNASGQLRDVIFYKSVYAENAGNPQGLIGAVLDETERKQASLELKESEKRFRAVFDNAMDGILVGNASTKKFVMANRGICDMLGYSADELLKLSVRDIHPEKELHKIIDIFERQARKEFRLAENLPVKRKDGTVFYADISSAPMSIGTDNFLVGVFRDITKRREVEIELQKAHNELEERVKERTERLSRANEELKAKNIERERAEQALAESEALLSTVFDSVQDGIIVAEAQSRRFRMCNAAMCHMLGYNRDELLNLGVAGIHPEEGIAYVVNQFERMAEGEIGIAPSLPMKRKDGAVFYADVSTGPMTIGGVACLVGVFRDITERGQTEQALRQSEARFRNLVETMSDWIWEVDAHGVYTYASPKIQDILGYLPEEVIGKTPFDLMTAAEAQRVADLFGASVSARKALVNIENVNLHKDGHRVVLETSGVPIVGQEGELCGYCGIDRDITERKKSEEALKQTYQDLRNAQAQLIQTAKLASIGQLSAGVAHELNQPLMVIRSTAQLIQRAIKKNQLEEDDLDKQLEAIERNTKRMMNIINHLRTFSRQSPLDFHPVDINRIIENSFLMMGEQLRLHDIEVKEDLAANLPKIQGDANQLEQVLLNLMINAKDAIEAAKNKRQRRIEMITRMSDEAKGAIEILVKDTGGGISKECLENIFDPFFTTKEVGKGTGLGLSISYGIVKDHKGEINVAETGPEGTTFRIRLPIGE